MGDHKIAGASKGSAYKVLLNVGSTAIRTYSPLEYKPGPSRQKIKNAMKSAGFTSRKAFKKAIKRIRRGKECV